MFICSICVHMFRYADPLYTYIHYVCISTLPVSDLYACSITVFVCMCIVTLLALTGTLCVSAFV